jgi:phage shock protein E
MNFIKNLFGKSTDLRALLQEGAVVIDVRSPLEYATGHMKGSRNIPLEKLSERFEEIRKLNKPVITVCRSGMRSNTASSFLKGKGLNAVNGGPWTSLQQIA